MLVVVVLAVELVPEEGVEELKVENKLSKDLELALEPRPGWRLILFKLPRIPASDLISEVILEAICRLGRLLDVVLEAVLEAVEVFLPVELFAVVAEEVLKELFDDVEGTAAGEAVEAVAVEAAEVTAAVAAAVAAVDSEAVLAVADPAPPAPKDPKIKGMP